MGIVYVDDLASSGRNAMAYLSVGEE
jgi:hypothetical protein